MRLLYSTPQGTFGLTDDLDDDPKVLPRYAILSHTWGADKDEVKFDDIRNGTANIKTGYSKLEFCAKQARKDGIDHFWIDTCCINKTSDAELSQAIRSMFRWYRNAVKCYVFLSDVSSSKRGADGRTDSVWEKNFCGSRWFTRGWTLQELLAPTIVEFFSREGALLGSKYSLMTQIHQSTGIPVTALHGNPIAKFSVEQRLAWADKRQTTKVEDKAYCLFGILDVQLPVLYGEGQDSALRRLRREIGVTLAQLDRMIKKKYEDGRLKVERLSGKSFSLENCYVNLGIVDYVPDSDTRSSSDSSDRGIVSKQLSRFSLAARLKIEAPPRSHQISLSTLFKPRWQKDGNQFQPNRVLIWGRAGMGKTTLCKKIVFEVYKNGLWKNLYDRVIWLPLRKLRRTESRNIIELLQDEFLLIGLGERVPETLNKLIRDRRTLFLLDGLDEVSFALDQDSPSGRILRELLSQPHVIITSRPHSTSLLDPKLLDLTLETVGFYPQQVEEYLQRVVKEANTSDETIGEIQSFIKERPLVRSLAGIPIQLDAISYTWNAKHFPRGNATMTSLYRMISQSLWRNSILRLGKIGDDGKFITRQQLDYWSWPRVEKFMQDEISFLQELGFRGLCENIVEFSLKDIEISETLQQVSRDKFVHLLFLRISDDSIEADDQTFHFIHLTFQEFFAAQYFVSSWIANKPLPLWKSSAHGPDRSNSSVTPENFAKSRKYVDHYDIFWRFVVGLLLTHSQREPLYRFLNMIEGEPVDLIGLAHQRLVIHCVSELNTGDVELQHQVKKFENRYLQWACDESRLNCEWARTEGSSSPRSTFLGSEPLQSRSLIWETECSDYILERLLDKGEVEQEALEALYSRSSLSNNMLDIVIQKLSKSMDRSVRSIAIKIFGQNCGHDQKQRLFYDKRYSEPVLHEIVYAWAGTRRLLEPAIETLVKLLPNSTHGTLAACALRDQANLPPSTIEALFQLSLDPGLDLAIYFKVATALSGQDNLPDPIIETAVQLMQQTDRDMRFNAMVALQRQVTLPESVINELVQLLHDSEQAARYEAAQILQGHVTLPKSAVEALFRLMQDPASEIATRRQAAMALGVQVTLPTPIVESFAKALQNSDRSMLSLAMKALQRQPTLTSPVIDALVRLLRGPSMDMRFEAASVLAGHATLPESAVEALVRLLHDEREHIHLRTKAAVALENQVSLPRPAVETVARVLRSQTSGQLSCDCICILKKYANLPSCTVELLVQMLEDTDLTERYDVAIALSKQASLPSSAIQALLRLLQDPNSAWRQARKESIEIITSRQDIQSLIPTLHASTLRHFMKHWFETSSAVCYIHEGCFCIRSSERFQKILLKPDQIEPFQTEWQKAKDELGIPSLERVLIEVGSV